jgi:hypothetical protein
VAIVDVLTRQRVVIRRLGPWTLILALMVIGIAVTEATNLETLRQPWRSLSEMLAVNFAMAFAYLSLIVAQDRGFLDQWIEPLTLHVVGFIIAALSATAFVLIL